MKLYDPRLPQSFWDRVITEPNSGCWLWTGLLTRRGYARCEIGGSHLAHRLMVNVPRGMTVDHKCETKCCVNPDHLQIVTAIENTQLYAARRQTCPRGHRRRPGAECRECRIARQRKYKAALKREFIAEIPWRSS